MDQSKLREYGLATVAANKPLNSNDIEVTPHEQLPMVNGQLTDNVNEYKASGTDASGASYQETLHASSTVKATWMPRGQTNRMTAPDVRRGTTVMLFKYADAPKLYWDTIDNDIHNRSLETVVYGFSGTAEPDVTPDDTNTYTLTVSTHQGIIKIKTSKANGELAAYELKIDAKNGVVSITDDLDNAITMDSGERHIKCQNGDHSFFEINKKVFNANADDYNIVCKRYSVTASESANLETPTNTIKASTTHDGNFGLGGDMSMYEGSNGQGGNNHIKGDTVVEGNLTVEKNLSVPSGTVSAKQVVSVLPIQAPNV